MTGGFSFGSAQNTGTSGFSFGTPQTTQAQQQTQAAAANASFSFGQTLVQTPANPGGTGLGTIPLAVPGATGGLFGQGPTASPAQNTLFSNTPQQTPVAFNVATPQITTQVPAGGLNLAPTPSASTGFQLGATVPSAAPGFSLGGTAAQQPINNFQQIAKPTTTVSSGFSLSQTTKPVGLTYSTPVATATGGLTLGGAVARPATAATTTLGFTATTLASGSTLGGGIGALGGGMGALGGGIGALGGLGTGTTGLGSGKTGLGGLGAGTAGLGVMGAGTAGLGVMGAGTAGLGGLGAGTAVMGGTSGLGAGTAGFVAGTAGLGGTTGLGSTAGLGGLSAGTGLGAGTAGLGAGTAGLGAGTAGLGGGLTLGKTTTATSVLTLGGLGNTSTLGGSNILGVAPTLGGPTTLGSTTATVKPTLTLGGAPTLGGLGGAPVTSSTGIFAATTTTTSVAGGIFAATTSTVSTGLGGVDPKTTSSGTGASGTIGKPGDSKAVKETSTLKEIQVTVDNFKKYVKNQKSVRENIARMSSTPLFKVQEEVANLKQLLSLVSNGLQRNTVTIDKLKLESAQELKHAEIAQRTKETPPGLQYEHTAPTEYFQHLVDGFEGHMIFYRQQIEEMEQHLNSLAMGVTLTPQEMSQILAKLHEAFIALAGQLQKIHEAVKLQKDHYLNYRRVFHGDTTDVFEKRRRARQAISNSVICTVGPSPFTGLSNATAAAMASTLNRSQQPPVAGLGINTGTTGLLGNPLVGAPPAITGSTFGTSTGFGVAPATTQSTGFGIAPLGGASNTATVRPLGSTGGSLFGSTATSQPSTGFNLTQPAAGTGFANAPSVAGGFGSTSFGAQTPGQTSFQLQSPPLGTKRGKKA